MFKRVNETSKTIDDLMKFLFYRLKENNMTITEVRMQKFIYKIKMELGKNHEIFNDLPYYWYFHGPYSEPVTNSFQNITSNYCNTTNNTSFELKELYQNFENNMLLNFPEIDLITKKIIKDREAFYNDLIPSIYKNYAPYPIMYPFRYNIFKIADDYSVLQDFDVDNYINEFYKCEVQLPDDNFFTDFSDIYSQLSTNLDMINDNNNLLRYWSFLRNVIIQLWKTFTSGVRVKYKDDYYNIKEHEWCSEFNKRVDNLSLIVDQTEKYITVNSSYNSYTHSQKNILNSTIGSYLRR